MIGHFRLLIIIAISITACDNSPVSSKGISLKDLSVEMHVSNINNKHISVEAVLNNGPALSGSNVEYYSGDKLIVSTVGDTFSNWDGDSFDSLEQLSLQVKELEKAYGGNSTFFQTEPIWYYTNMDISLANSRFTLILDRADSDSSHSSSVQLPKEFEITYPAPNENISRSSEINLSWNNIDEATGMVVTTALICISGKTNTWESEVIFPDIGGYTIPENTFANFNGVCNLTLQISRTSLGVLDPAFTSGGILLGHQIRSVVVVTFP